MKKVGNNSKRGGARDGAGRRPTGQTKEKISISVDRKTLANAMMKWGGKKSPLFEKLLQDYLK
jgi:hypothetical protein